MANNLAVFFQFGFDRATVDLPQRKRIERGVARDRTVLAIVSQGRRLGYRGTIGSHSGHLHIRSGGACGIGPRRGLRRRAVVELRFIDIESPSSDSRVGPLGGGGYRGGAERKYQTQCERLQESIHVVS